jgi:hypothetical protein
MPIPTKMTDLATLASSNSPAGTDAIGNTLDDYLRALSAILRSTNAIDATTIPSAASVNIGAASAEAVTITGSATITSLGTAAAGLVRECLFTGAATLTSNVNILLPSGNITTVANDVYTFRSQGSGIWRLIASSKAIPGMASITYAMIQNVSATDKVLGRSSPGAGSIEEIACTAVGRAVIGAASASAQRTALGLGSVATQGANALIVSETKQDVTAVASTTIDLALGQVIQLAQAVNITTLAFSNVPTGGVVVTIRRTKDASGTARTIAWPASVKWASGTAPTLTSTASCVDIISLLSLDGGTTWDGVFTLDSR